MEILRRFIYRRRETLEQRLARMIAETSAFLTECLRHPEYAVRIPIVRADAATFPRSLTAAFWDPVLGD